MTKDLKPPEESPDKATRELLVAIAKANQHCNPEAYAARVLVFLGGGDPEEIKPDEAPPVA